LLPHPQYSPDLAFHLFGPMKESLGGVKFENDEDVQQYVCMEVFTLCQKDFYTTGLRQLVQCWEHCIELKGVFVEK